MQINYSKLRSPFINTGRNTLKQNNLTDEQYKELVNQISSDIQVDTPEVPEIQDLGPVKKETKSTETTDWTTDYRITDEPTESAPVVESKPAVKTEFTVNTKNTNRDRLRKYLLDRGIDESTVDALVVHAGAESGYNHQIKNPTSSAYGLGQWIQANHKPVLDYINQKKGTNYTDISQLDFDDLAEALAWWYYDKNKSALDSQSGTYNKVKTLAKIGLAPAILSQGLYTSKAGKTYKDTDEDWLAWFNDTGHNPKGKITSFDQHIASRYKHAGYV